MVRAAVALALGVLLAACTPDEPERAALPDGIVLHIDQTRVERPTRNVFVRVKNDTGQLLAISGFVLTSPRFDPVSWDGDEQVEPGRETDLEFVMPTTRCGDGVRASVRLTYRFGGSEMRTSPAPAVDPYDAIALLMERDCARSILSEAAELAVGDPVVEGSGRVPVLRVPVMLTPTGRRDDVRFGGFESTPLFRQHEDSPVDVDVPIDTDRPTRIDMRVVPARCDAHALAEDKIGRLFGVRVRGPGLGDHASFHLPLDREQRAAFYAYFHTRCGL